MGPLEWSVVDKLWIIPLEKTDFPFSRCHRMAVAPSLRVKTLEPFPLPVRRSMGFFLGRPHVCLSYEYNSHSLPRKHYLSPVIPYYWFVQILCPPFFHDPQALGNRCVWNRWPYEYANDSLGTLSHSEFSALTAMHCTEVHLWRGWELSYWIERDTHLEGSWLLCSFSRTIVVSSLDLVHWLKVSVFMPV